jgi:membrane-bound acyltransferase YfiQ involved in biofilm formation
MQKILILTRKRPIKIWLFLTMVYLLLVLGVEGLVAENLPAALVGMFVPVGVWVALQSYGLAVVLVFLAMLALDNFFVKTDTSFFKKRLVQVGLTLLALFLLVMIFDFFLFGEFVSLQALLHQLGLAESPSAFDCC